MEKIKITCDSTCDLTPELYQKYDIDVIPLGITLGEEMRTDGVDVTPLDLYDYVSRTGRPPKTSAVSIGSYESVFSKYAALGYKVIHINVSSTVSSCYQNACIAASGLDGVFPFDSLTLTIGSGLLVLAAAEMVQAGSSAEEILSALTDMRERYDVSFLIQTLDYLKISGRCSAVAALGANLLKLRPEIIVKNGNLIVGKKYRGNRFQTMYDYTRNKLSGRTDIDLRRALVGHTGLVPDEEFEKLVALIKELQPFEEVLTTRAGCTISTHGGPEAYAVMFLTKPQ